LTIVPLEVKTSQGCISRIGPQMLLFSLLPWGQSKAIDSVVAVSETINILADQHVHSKDV